MNIAIVFDSDSRNWMQDRAANDLFLKATENYFNSLLVVRGHVFLNEIYDALGVPRTRIGQLIGWFRQEGSNTIEFFPIPNKDGSIVVTFNVDGQIYDRLPE